MATARRVATMAQAYRDICASVPPWVAVGDFLSEWLESSGDQRGDLVAEPLGEPPGSEGELRRWAAFCAAAVEWLCVDYDVPCPSWVANPAYILEEPWYDFDAPGAHKPEVHAYLARVTPEPFRRRNVYCGNRVFANKYDLAKRLRQVRPHSVEP